MDCHILFLLDMSLIRLAFLMVPKLSLFASTPWLFRGGSHGPLTDGMGDKSVRQTYVTVKGGRIR